MDPVIILQWDYSPTDYFEAELIYDREGYNLKVNEGEIEARIDPDFYDTHPGLRESLNNELNDRFLAAQLINRQPFKISTSKIIRVNADGRRAITMELGLGGYTLAFGKLDIIKHDAKGNIILDTKKDRIEKRISLADKISKFAPRDVTLRLLLESFNNGILDPDNELVHLFEIFKRLSKKFGGQKVTVSTLGINESDRRRFGELCNALPLRQSRHRGEFEGELRDATQDELNEARTIAQKMIERYVQYLENSSSY